ncbi:primosomal protein [Anopheles sinensis]|uniref:Primosomal protein n=1 Tax=Anopheles sinensis TaxID=74873 RepID=A0A084WKI0_ANOSI|nr:primosomal protein [Anopheles sinensis]
MNDLESSQSKALKSRVECGRPQASFAGWFREAAVFHTRESMLTEMERDREKEWVWDRVKPTSVAVVQSVKSEPPQPRQRQGMVRWWLGEKGRIIRERESERKTHANHPAKKRTKTQKKMAMLATTTPRAAH